MPHTEILQWRFFFLLYHFDKIQWAMHAFIILLFCFFWYNICFNKLEARYGFCWPSKSFWVERTPSRKTCQKAQPSVEENRALKWIWWTHVRTCLCHMQTTKTQISLHRYTVWSLSFIICFLDSVIYIDAIPKLSRLLLAPVAKQSKKISNDQELIQSDPTSCPQNQTGNN